MIESTPPGGRAAARIAAIVNAVLDLLREVGYDDLTIDAVAARAGASKATIYRRWPDKRSLVCDALVARSREVALPSDAGSLREDLIRLVALMAGLAEMEQVPAFASLLAAAQRDPVIAETLWGVALEPRRQECRDVVHRAIGRGELHDPALAGRLFDLIIGEALVCYLIHHQHFDTPAQTDFVDAVLLPTLTNPRP
ncbi:TetR/AcrR family transcriptional regulator [Actinoplanes sp. NPDC020271]|uniref:TetR/AcrR family transcriptional regulator n=1 Tax=Actinoplanes sp. NPDC020271 TaxID=3363896 RepID=UPI003795740F